MTKQQFECREIMIFFFVFFKQPSFSTEVIVAGKISSFSIEQPWSNRHILFKYKKNLIREYIKQWCTKFIENTLTIFIDRKINKWISYKEAIVLHSYICMVFFKVENINSCNAYYLTTTGNKTNIINKKFPWTTKLLV